MDFVSSVPSLLTTDNTATYSCTLTNTWSATTHPIDYGNIANSAHWSPPVLVTHNREYELWAPDSLASPGIELVAEAGVTGAIESELSAAQSEGNVGEFVVGEDQFNAFDPPQTLSNIQLSPEFPLLSSISMVAPSPDWFTGIPNFAPFDGGVWYESFDIATGPWDAGTETGETYALNNDPEPVQLPIAQITAANAPTSGALLDPSGTTILPMATWSCVLQDRVTAPPVVNETPPEGPVGQDEISISVPEEDVIDVVIIAPLDPIDTPATPVFEPPTDPMDTPDDPMVVVDAPPSEPIETPDSLDQDVVPIVNDNPMDPLVPQEDVIDVVSDTPDEENNNNGVCGRYFDTCDDDSDCCSSNCVRNRCNGRKREENGRRYSLRLGSRDSVGGEAARRRSGGRKLATTRNLGHLRGFQ